jgi:transposase-like protein
MTPFNIPESVFLKLEIKCIHCGSSRIASHGPNYRCKEEGCGKVFRKNFRRRRISPKERPPCPDCGAGNPYSDGSNEWVCRVCGRNFTDKSEATKSINSDMVFIDSLEVQVE